MVLSMAYMIYPTSMQNLNLISYFNQTLSVDEGKICFRLQQLTGWTNLRVFVIGFTFTLLKLSNIKVLTVRIVRPLVQFRQKPSYPFDNVIPVLMYSLHSKYILYATMPILANRHLFSLFIPINICIKLILIRGNWQTNCGTLKKRQESQDKHAITEKGRLSGASRSGQMFQDISIL